MNEVRCPKCRKVCAEMVPLEYGGWTVVASGKGIVWFEPYVPDDWEGSWRVACPRHGTVVWLDARDMRAKTPPPILWR